MAVLGWIFAGYVTDLTAILYTRNIQDIPFFIQVLVEKPFFMLHPGNGIEYIFPAVEYNNTDIMRDSCVL